MNYANGWILFCTPAGGVWGYLLGEIIPRVLMNCFGVHITEDAAEKIFFSSIVIGVYVGLFLSIFVKRRMDKYARTHTTKEYVLRFILEIIILSVIIIIGLLCIKGVESNAGDFVYPKE